jgi:glycosyltransferase involved in cell wall biosynthesis
LKVALLSHEGGGISSVCQGLAQCLSKEKIETTIFSTVIGRKVEIEKVNDYLEIIRLPLINYPPRSFWLHLRNMDTLQRLLENHDIVHAISPEMAVPYTFFKKDPQKSFIMTLHGSHKAALKAFIQSPIKNWVSSDFAFHVLELPMHEIITKRCFAKSNKVIVCSFATLNELKMYERLDISKVSVIYNGVNFSEIQQEEAETRDENEDGEHELSVIYAGRLFWMKGITFALRAYEKSKKQFKNLRLKIFGKGPLENEVKKFVTEKGLRNSVYFGGFLPHTKLIQEIKKSDVVVFPSLYESQPMFVLETMACKKPVVAFNVAYANELIKNGYNGLLAKPYDVEDLSNKITMLLQDKDLRLKLGDNSFEYVKKNHDWGVQAEKYRDIYCEVMKERN